MNQREKKKPEPTGPALTGEQVCELWVCIWSELDGLEQGEERKALDEVRRLAVAFDRAMDWRNYHDFRNSRFVRDQDAVHTAVFAHYLLTRAEQWSAALGTPDVRREAEARLAVLNNAGRCFTRLVGVSPSSMRDSFERLEVGVSHKSVFHPEAREGVTIESLEAGPALPREREARSQEARARWQAQWEAERGRPKKRRALSEVTS